jgi:hypothetical protein
VELKPFSQTWEELRLNDEDLDSLQAALLAQPKGGDLIPGTGGLRKFRFAPSGWPRGKSSALRVCYIYFEEMQIVVLALVYSKGRKDDLSGRERMAMAKQIERIRASLEIHCHRLYPNTK